MKYKQSIKIEFKCLEDLFRLPCVIGLKKFQNADGGIVVELLPHMMANNDTHAYRGQWLCERYDGKWFVV